MNDAKQNLLLIKSIVDCIKRYETTTLIEKSRDFKSRAMSAIENNKNLVLAKIPMDATTESLINSELAHVESYERAYKFDRQQILDFIKTLDYKTDSARFKKDIFNFVTQLRANGIYYSQLSDTVYQELSQ
jgi:hypothetical protein